jgi:hypothetical protein
MRPRSSQEGAGRQQGRSREEIVGSELLGLRSEGFIDSAAKL